MLADQNEPRYSPLGVVTTMLLVLLIVSCYGCCGCNPMRVGKNAAPVKISSEHPSRK